MSADTLFPKGRLEIGPVHHDHSSNTISAVVCGHRVWFQVEGAPLSVTSEVFAAAFLIPAALSGLKLEVAGGISSAFSESGLKVLEKVSPWWANAIASPGPVSTAVSDEVPPSRARSALCFSCGVDSFYSLFEYNPDLLLFVSGFDIPLERFSSWRSTESAVTRVAEAAGKRVVLIRTNLRENPFFALHDWERTHGGALVAAGHLIRSIVTDFWISASFPDSFLHPWGSHPHVDPLWSTPRLTVTHKGSDRDRLQKIALHGDNPLLLGNLRVCWQNPSVSGNCGVCEKCLRNRLCLWYEHPRARCLTFPSHDSLVEDLRHCEPLPNHNLVAIYHRYLKDRDSGHPVVVAVRDYIARSRSLLLAPTEGDLRSIYTA